MVSIDAVERGAARFIEEQLLPGLPRNGAKGFTIGVAAALMIKRGGGIIRTYADSPLIKQLGLISPDGAVDLDALRDAAKENIPATGVVFDLPMGIAIRINAADVDALYDFIRREASV